MLQIADWKVASWLPEGATGNARIEREYVDKKEADRGAMRAVVSGSGRCVPVGVYTGLRINDALVMSDTPDEIHDHISVQAEARGRVLLHGLGIGMIAAACLRKPEVEHITIVEKNPHVITLVAPHLLHRFGGTRRIRIFEADALTWKPTKGERWNVVWHDIWTNISEDNLPEMKTLHRRFGRRADWQDSWCRWQCER